MRFSSFILFLFCTFFDYTEHFLAKFWFVSTIFFRVVICWAVVGVALSSYLVMTIDTLTESAWFCIDCSDYLNKNYNIIWAFAFSGYVFHCCEMDLSSVDYNLNFCVVAFLLLIGLILLGNLLHWQGVWVPLRVSLFYQLS